VTERTLLIAPPFYRLMGSHFNGLHLGISYIAAVLKQHGHDVSVYNADYSDTSEYLDQQQLFHNFDDYKQILNDLEHPIWNEIKANISGYAPDYVGITMLTANYKAVKNIARIVRLVNKDIKVVVGGTHPTLDPEGTMAEIDFDYLIRGEGEFAFLELINGKKEEGILGLSFRANKKVIHNPDRPFIADLDILPFPNRDSFLNGNDHADLNFMMTGRGCPFSCSYCVSPQFWHRKVRFRSVENVIEEIEYLNSEDKSSVIHFVDDTFTLQKDRAKAICQGLIDRHINVNWVCDTRADCLDEELIDLMKRSGCVRVKLGVESGSDKMLEKMHKGVTTKEIRRVVSIIKDRAIPLTIYLMTGFPDETEADLKQTIQFARELDVDYYSLSILSPYFGTEVWNDLVKSGRALDKEHWEYFYHQSHEMLVNDSLSLEIVEEFFTLDKQGRGKRL
jgi:radical SAM superfamily enzyme YgiQ (UPF0313 family)